MVIPLSQADRLQTWKNKYGALGGLSRMMRDYLAVCGSGVGMERVFNISGAVCQENRGRLSVDSIKMRTVVKFHDRELSKSCHVQEETLLPSDVRRLDTMMEDELAISDDDEKFGFVTSPKRKRNAATRGDDRLFLDDDDSDELAADEGGRGMVGDKDDVVLVTDEETSIPEDSELDSSSPEPEAMSSRQRGKQAVYKRRKLDIDTVSQQPSTTNKPRGRGRPPGSQRIV